MESILYAENLTRVFSRKGQQELVAVDHVSFELFPGECLGIIGESGSGKSTIAGLVTRLIDPTEGRIVLEGRDITTLRGKELRDIYKTIQLVFQTPAESFDPRCSLGDGIGESLVNSGMRRSEAGREVERLLDECGLDKSFAGKYPFEVSGGQCQRAAIARALAIKPKVLVCDEATSSLDVTIQKDIMELLMELRKKKGNDLSILFICHDIALVQQFCDRVLVMCHGRVAEEGIPDDIVRNPGNEYTKRLIESIL
ncbi:MAG: dipeptide/oligopeptide/nickel ABC transporter ATP-binding protein [Butyrivibrio sp.]|nr:dipeptide/oligopeptide/nickel ABC transporter ATP-binding protein [Butyrivibrio sp.]